MADLPKKVLRESSLYLGDNGRCLCGKHSGMTAQYTGRDLSGQRVAEVTARDAEEAKMMGFALRCESCGLDFYALAFGQTGKAGDFRKMLEQESQANPQS